jgi:dCMP deaminase
MEPNKWDKRFLEMAKLVSTWSKDPKTKVGCVVVRDRRILATGYNGFAKGLDDSEQLYLDRDYKMRKIIHAEQNAIYNATSAGVSLNGSTFYVWGLHICEQCAQALISIGAKRVVIQNNPLPDRWKESCLNASFDMNYVGMEYDSIDLMNYEY